MEIVAENIGKNFNDRPVFRNINFSIRSGESLAIVGPNGSGKTTLLRLICHLLQPSEGNIIYSQEGALIDRENIYKYIALVGPYLELYEDLTAFENLKFFSRMKDIVNADARIEILMKKFSLAGRGNDLVKTYSSGMKQRLKYVFALLSKPELLLVDEPGSNLDEEGLRTAYKVMEEQKQENILILATNDRNDLKYADRILSLND